jgi:hypothetical protein
VTGYIIITEAISTTFMNLKGNTNGWESAIKKEIAAPNIIRRKK